MRRKLNLRNVRWFIRKPKKIQKRWNNYIRGLAEEKKKCKFGNKLDPGNSQHDFYLCQFFFFWDGSGFYKCDFVWQKYLIKQHCSLWKKAYALCCPFTCFCLLSDKKEGVDATNTTVREEHRHPQGLVHLFRFHSIVTSLCREFTSLEFTDVILTRCLSKCHLITVYAVEIQGDA